MGYAERQDIEAMLLAKARRAYRLAQVRKHRNYVITGAASAVSLSLLAMIAWLGSAAPWPARAIAGAAGIVALGCAVYALRSL